MLPTLVLGSFAIPTFPLLLLLAFAVGSSLGAAQARHVGYEPEHVWRMLPWAAAAGVLGAKLYYLIAFGGGAGVGALLDGGMVWYGGAVTGTAAAAWRIRRTLGAPLHHLFDYGAPCLAAGHAVGRIGCFLVGDDWGVPTDLPWGVAFPGGAPPSTAASLRAFGVDVPAGVPDAQVFAVHPTQLYEAAGLALLAWLLWRASRRPFAPWALFAGYLVGYGVLRFAVELLRAKDDRLSVGLTVAQLISVCVVASGVAVLLRRRHAAPALSTP
jgi:phosphatidylglycerol---prolipoprotein diacylglyceryl transferase